MRNDAGGLAFEHPLPRESASVALARATVSQTLATVGYLGRADDVLLLVSELVTNALVHGDGIPQLRLRCDSFRVRIEVEDSGAGTPASRSPGPTGGWGLNLVERLSAAWGVSHGAGGKVVWCELSAPGTPAAITPAVGPAAA